MNDAARSPRTIDLVPSPQTDAIRLALSGVLDPEIRKPITELDMIESIDVDPGGAVTIKVLLTTAACPLKDQITNKLIF